MIKAPLLLAAAWHLCTQAADGRPSRLKKGQQGIEQTILYSWPLIVWQVPIGCIVTGQEGQVDLCDRLAAVATEGHRKYLDEILPAELRVDPEFAESYEAGDGTRNSLAFYRWQRRAFSLAGRVPAEELAWSGEPIPHLPGINYNWMTFWGSPDYLVLQVRLQGLARDYLHDIADSRANEQMRAFLWVDVFSRGEPSAPRQFTGALVHGFVPVRLCQGESSQQVTVQDPRGPVPPFGKTRTYELQLGQVVMWPSWTSHFFTTNSCSEPVVLIQFLLWPSTGVAAFDWEDDPVGQYVREETSEILDPAKARSEL